MCSWESTRFFQVFGMKGMLISENQRPTELLHLTADGATCDPLKHSFPQRYHDSYVNALNAFADILQGWLTLIA